MLVPVLRNAATQYHAKAKTHRDKAENLEEQKRAARYNDKCGGQWQICKDMGSSFAAPLVAVKRVVMGPRGQAAGTIATSTKEVDSILRQTLKGIYDGNVENPEQTAKEYVKDYDRYLFKQKTARIDQLQGEDLESTAAEMRESASGLDNWAPADLKMLPRIAYDQLAVMLNMIEAGTPWPEDIMKARAAFLATDSEDEQNPAAYRVLLMLSAVYRLWSKTRLLHMQPWVASWALPEMYAGIEGRGAEDAAYTTGLLA